MTQQSSEPKLLYTGKCISCQSGKVNCGRSIQVYNVSGEDNPRAYKAVGCGGGTYWLFASAVKRALDAGILVHAVDSTHIPIHPPLPDNVPQRKRLRSEGHVMPAADNDEMVRVMVRKGRRFLKRTGDPLSLPDFLVYDTPNVTLDEVREAARIAYGLYDKWLRNRGDPAVGDS